MNLFIDAMNSSEPSGDVEKRVAILIDYFTYSLYRNVCRSLFEKDKLLYSFLVCSKLMIAQNRIGTAELKFLLSGVVGAPPSDGGPKPAAWIPDRAWTELLQASLLPQYKSLPAEIRDLQADWLTIYNHVDPASCPLPGDLDKKYSRFQKLTILRCLRPDKVVQQVQALVVAEMGQRFVEPPPFDLQMCYQVCRQSARCPHSFGL